MQSLTSRDYKNKDGTQHFYKNYEFYKNFLGQAVARLVRLADGEVTNPRSGLHQRGFILRETPHRR
jgi:hypothetical protein